MYLIKEIYTVDKTYLTDRDEEIYRLFKVKNLLRQGLLQLPNKIFISDSFLSEAKILHPDQWDSSE